VALLVDLPKDDTLFTNCVLIFFLFQFLAIILQVSNFSSTASVRENPLTFLTRQFS
jgi:hypothetical protein